jgi:hypothetical protein
MRYRVVQMADTPSEGDEVLLVVDRWNDWFTWVTQFFAIAVSVDGSRTDIGHVKIARAGMTNADSVTERHLPSSFPLLGEDWISIGQSENYYETLNALGPDYRRLFLRSLRDCAGDLSILDRYCDEPVVRKSLLRDIDMDRVRNRFHRLANGDAALTPYAFKYAFAQDPHSLDDPPTLTFSVQPNSQPPTNVHVIIGRNGVGKTRCFDLLARTFLGLPAPHGGSAGLLGPLHDRSFTLYSDSHGFAGLVTVSFSPFDRYGPLVTASGSMQVKYAYVGLIRNSAQELNAPAGIPPTARVELAIKAAPELATDFVNSVKECRTGARRARWTRALGILEADPLFEEANVSNIADDEAIGWEDRASHFFQKLSSGHGIVLLIITKLIEIVEEKSLVLIDEPEGHLHPPLLSAFVRALSELLIDRNGVAIIATHSPVVLQEVPRSCVWILNRSGHSLRADRPELETFGENVGVLTREVFGLEVVQTGFHRMITDALASRSYEDVLSLFQNQLGGEARALARALSLIQRDPQLDVDSE